MYKYIFTLAFAVLFSCKSNAQFLNNAELVASLGGGINLNRADVRSTGTYHNLHLKNREFFSASGGLRVPFKRYMFASMEIGLAVSKERLRLSHPINTEIYQEEFTNQYFFFRMIIGVHLPVEKSGFDLGIGFVNNLSQNNQASATKIFYNEQSGNSTINHTLQTNWGNSNGAKIIRPANILAEFQIAYVNRSILPKDRMLRVAFTTDIGIIHDKKHYNTNDNAAQVNYYEDNGSERILTGKEVFADKNFRVGLDVSMSF